MTSLRVLFAAALIAWVPMAFAQAPQNQPAPWLQLGYTTLSATGSSTNVALPGFPGSGHGFLPGTLAVVCNTSTTTDAFATVGTASSLVATITSTRIPFGQCVPLSAGGNKYVAGITASGAATLTVSTGTGTPFALRGRGGSAGPSNVLLTGHTDILTLNTDLATQ